MGRKYEHLSAEERATIMIGRDGGLSLRAIARRLGRSASTISREASRGRVGDGRYGASQAGRRYRERRRQCVRHRRLMPGQPLFERARNWLL